jgi:hypothetical protein
VLCHKCPSLVPSLLLPPEATTVVSITAFPTTVSIYSFEFIKITPVHCASRTRLGLGLGLGLGFAWDAYNSPCMIHETSCVMCTAVGVVIIKK